MDTFFEEFEGRSHAIAVHAAVPALLADDVAGLDERSGAVLVKALEQATPAIRVKIPGRYVSAPSVSNAHLEIGTSRHAMQVPRSGSPSSASRRSTGRRQSELS